MFKQIRLIITDNLLKLALFCAPKYTPEKNAIAWFLLNDYENAVKKTYEKLKNK